MIEAIIDSLQLHIQKQANGYKINGKDKSCIPLCAGMQDLEVASLMLPNASLIPDP
jgi:hypothetical protein